MTNRFNLYQTARLAMFAGLITVASGLAQAQTPQCSILKGTYAFTFGGMSVIPGTPAAIPFAGVGIQIFDGAGKFTATESANFGVTVLRNAAFSGTYTLNPDCTGTMTAKFPDGSSGGGQDFVVADGGKIIYAVGVGNSGPGASLTTTFTRMPLTW
jgi:hypothetical protein